MRKRLLANLLCLTATLSLSAHALQLGKPIIVPLKTKDSTLKAGIPLKQVALMNFQLTPQEREMIFNYVPKQAVRDETNSDIPDKISLGMNKVPVLDQGMHGTCVTFAESAALDAVLGKGDYVSPLCSLQLGHNLANNGYYPSGWDGSYGPLVLDQMMRFGVVNTGVQRKVSCGGEREYPLYGQTPEHGMSLANYKKISEDLSEKLYWLPLMNFNEKPTKDFEDSNKINWVFQEVKKALAKGNRATFGTFIVIPAFKCTVGACATHNVNEDTWAVTKEVNDPKAEVGGHEMVITGYDDNAVAVDGQGKKHTGLFTLRNSWGAGAGDKGDFYMTYEYFKKFAGEVQVIVPVDNK